MTAFDGQIALVTGGNRGLGLELCRHLASNGATVLLGARDADLGEVVGGKGDLLVESADEDGFLVAERLSSVMRLVTVMRLLKLLGSNCSLLSESLSLTWERQVTL